MNLWFRLLALLGKDLFGRRPRLGYGDEVLTTFRVWLSDLDTNLHMNNGRYLTLMDLGRLDYMARIGLAWTALRQGLLPVLGAAQVVYLKPLLLGQKFAIGTKLVFWDERWFVMQQRFFVGDKVVSKAFVRGMFRRGNQAVPPAQVMRLGHQPAPERLPPPADVALWLASLAEQRAAAARADGGAQ